jgi:hypothetical protein
MQPVLSEELRKEIFHALVEIQDQGMAVPESRKVIAARFGLSRKQVQVIEREGMDNDWPPL